MSYLLLGATLAGAPAATEVAEVRTIRVAAATKAQRREYRAAIWPTIASPEDLDDSGVTPDVKDHAVRALASAEIGTRAHLLSVEYAFEPRIGFGVSYYRFRCVEELIGQGPVLGEVFEVVAPGGGDGLVATGRPSPPMIEPGAEVVLALGRVGFVLDTRPDARYRFAQSSNTAWMSKVLPDGRQVAMSTDLPHHGVAVVDGRYELVPVATDPTTAALLGVTADDIQRELEWQRGLPASSSSPTSEPVADSDPVELVGWSSWRSFLAPGMQPTAEEVEGDL